MAFTVEIRGETLASMPTRGTSRRYSNLSIRLTTFLAPIDFASRLESRFVSSLPVAAT
jgi:hypothetical protein